MAYTLSTYKRATRLYATNAKDNQDDTTAIDELNEINKGIQDGRASARRKRASARLPRGGSRRAERKSTWFKSLTVRDLNHLEL